MSLLGAQVAVAGSADLRLKRRRYVLALLVDPIDRVPRRRVL